MQDTKRLTVHVKILLGLFLIFGIFSGHTLFGQSLDIPSKKWGLSIGNSKEFTGLRFNFRDSKVRRITGVNFTLWQPRKDNKEAVVHGISLGLIPGGGIVRGIQVGLLGASAEKSMVGLNIGGLGVGAGGRIDGINIGGLGVGAGEDVTGFSIGGLGVGSGGSLKGLCVGGLGAGAGDDVTGLAIGGLGVGAGGDFTGIALAGLGAGCGGRFTGIAICGLAAGAPEVRGLLVGGFGVGGKNLKGVFVGGALIKVEKEGRLSGLAASSFNWVSGTLSGLSIGIVNYAWKLDGGIQIGLINIVRDNPKGLKVLPIFNADFDRRDEDICLQEFLLYHSSQRRLSNLKV